MPLLRKCGEGKSLPRGQRLPSPANKQEPRRPIPEETNKEISHEETRPVRSCHEPVRSPWRSAYPASADAVADAKAYVEKVTKPNPPWDGPTPDPGGQAGKTIVYVSADQRNGGARGAGEGVQEAAGKIGWTFRIIDGQGSVAGPRQRPQPGDRLKARRHRPRRIDATEQAAAVEEAAKQGIVVIGWHSYCQVRPARQAADLHQHHHRPARGGARRRVAMRCARSDGKVGAVIFTDSAYEIAVAKSNAMADVIKACGDCKVLEIVDTPLSRRLDAHAAAHHVAPAALRQEPGPMRSEHQRPDLRLHGAVARPRPASTATATRAISPPATAARSPSSASVQASTRSATVAEPLRLQGWQVVDEANRALNKEKHSGYVAPAHLFLPSNIKFDGGAEEHLRPGERLHREPT